MRERVSAFFLFACFGAWFCWAQDAVFKADDYPAIAYATDWGRVLQDFASSQYGLSFFVFWRPAITTSLAVDHALFGIEAAGFFAMNALAFALSTYLLWTLVRALCPERPSFAWAAALLWILHPAPVVSLHWVVGRVDTHSVLPILLTCALHLRYRRGRGTRVPVLLCLCLSLASKESAIGLPLLLLGLDLLDRHPSLPGGPAFRGRALPALVYLAVLPLFFGLRALVLGTPLGGYGFLQGEALDFVAIFDGLRQSLAQAIVPGFGSLARDGIVLVLVTFTGVWALVASRSRRVERVLGVLLVSAGIWAPLAQLLPSMRDPAQQRYAYFACVWSIVAWCGLSAWVTHRAFAASKPRELAHLVLALLPLVLLLPERAREIDKMRRHDAFCTQFTGAVREVALHGKGTGDRVLPEPLALGGNAEAANHPQRMLWGLTHVHAPPFARPKLDIISLRKIAPYAAAVPTELVPESFAAWLEVDAAGELVVPRRRAPGKVQILERTPRGFDGTLDVEDWARLVASDSPLGFEASGPVDSVAVLSSVGSAWMRVPKRDGELRLRDLLLSNVAWQSGPQSATPLIHLILNPLDLAPESPIYLVWRDRDGVGRARFAATRAFTRLAIAELAPD